MVRADRSHYLEAPMRLAISVVLFLARLGSSWDHSTDDPAAPPWRRENWTIAANFLGDIQDYTKRWVPQTPPEQLPVIQPPSDLPESEFNRGVHPESGRTGELLPNRES